MLHLIAFAAALVGSSVAAAWDLRTTEIPDPIPYAMIAIALIIYGYQSIAAWDYIPLVNSIAVGAVLFGFGFLLYYFGQWGGGDVKLLSAIGFLLPNIDAVYPIFPELYLWFPFPMSYLFNVFFVGAIYMLTYAFGLALLNRKIFREFNREVKASAKLIIASSVTLFIVFVFINWYFAKDLRLPSIGSAWDSFILVNSLVPLGVTVGLFLVWKFVRAVESVAFKKRIPVKKLRAGDVLLDSKVWDGITERQLKRIQRSNKRYVWIKEGVRFAPAFPLALLFTVYFGDAILFLFRFLI
jgi:prepilin signal peptidase PulO-like enzyme (type II secretory pathway)